MTREKKLEVLLATAKAYYDRNEWCQYDQRSMDRLIQLSPRRRKRLPPESATAQHIQFLDCSGYTTAVFLEAFGYELPHDLTWHMVDFLEPQVFYYELTHEETHEELSKICDEIKKILKPGDLVCHDRGVGSGHIMLYLGDEVYSDCRPGNGGDGYDYENHKNRFYERGVWHNDANVWFEIGKDRPYRSLFHEKIRRISISRPLDLDLTPTSNALARIGEAKDLVCGVLTSHAGALHASKGEKVTYTVFVKNLGEDKEVHISFSAPDNTKFEGETSVKANTFTGKTLEINFTVEVLSDEEICLEAPFVTVNSLNVYAPRVLLGKKFSDNELLSECERIKTEIKSGKTALEAISHKRDIDVFRSLFYLHDTPLGDVLSRREQVPSKDMGIYSMYGGVGVITPAIASVEGVRCTHITKSDLIAGDVILISDDALGKGLYSCFYDGNSFYGKFEAEEETSIINGEKLDEFIDSLFGRFCFVVLRHSLSL